MRRWSIRILAALAILILIIAAAIWTLAFWPRRVAHPPLQLATGKLAIQHALIYTSPDSEPIHDGTVLIAGGRITAVGTQLPVPPDATILPCDDCTVTAGFWNAHVHFTESKWNGAEWKPAAQLSTQLADMFLSRGFTTVVDCGSNLSDTLAIRRRIENTELAGPFIYTAGGAIYPPHGIPYYLMESLPHWLLPLLAQPDTPDAAVKDVDRNLAAGADITKLFTGSYIARGTVLPMPLEIAKSAVADTHRQGKLVFAHPSDQTGTRVAIDSGVDVLAHAPDSTDGIDQAFLSNIVNHKMSMIPTLKMFATTVTTKASYLDPIYAEVHQFHDLGGQLIFGTDVGYMTDYSTQGEFEGLTKSGLKPMEILAMLTTNPAAKLGVSETKGTIQAGKLADLTILDADPAQDSQNFAKVRATIRSGRAVFQR